MGQKYVFHQYMSPCKTDIVSSNRRWEKVTACSKIKRLKKADVYAIQEVHLATVVEVLQSIKQSDMSPILNRMYSSEGGTDALDVLMKYLYFSPPQSLYDQISSVKL